MLTEFTWQDSKGIQIQGVEWKPDGDVKGIITLVHGLGEHCRRYSHFAEFFNQHGLVVQSFDLPGHGKSAAPPPTSITSNAASPAPRKMSSAAKPNPSASPAINSTISPARSNAKSTAPPPTTSPPPPPPRPAATATNRASGRAAHRIRKSSHPIPRAKAATKTNSQAGIRTRNRTKAKARASHRTPTGSSRNPRPPAAAPSPVS